MYYHIFDESRFAWNWMVKTIKAWCKSFSNLVWGKRQRGREQEKREKVVCWRSPGSPKTKTYIGHGDRGMCVHNSQVHSSTTSKRFLVLSPLQTFNQGNYKMNNQTQNGAFTFGQYKLYQQYDTYSCLQTTVPEQTVRGINEAQGTNPCWLMLTWGY